MPEKSDAVHVEIFGQSYAVQAGPDPAYVEQLAGYVDAQMRDVSRAAGAVDSVRVAVLAALNIADELFQARARLEDGDQGLRQRAQRLARELAGALDEK